MASFTAFARRFASAEDLPPVRNVWDFGTDELSSIGFQTLRVLARSEFAADAERIAYISQALVEFADLQDMAIPPGGGRYYNANFFYFEGIAALREAVLTGLNGCFHASLAVLRATFELFVLDSWWKSRRVSEQNYSEFYAWFDGTSTSPGAGKVLKECYAERPDAAPSEAEARDVYRRLCSYVHKPSFRESVTTIRQRTVEDGVAVIRSWLDLLMLALGIILDLAVRCSPRCLFPVDVTRKFGFNAPVGMFFDESNTIALAAALGPRTLQEYRAFYSKDGLPTEVQWALEHADLSDEQITATWADDQPMPETASAAEAVQVGAMLVKAKTRVLAQLFAYDANAPSLPDFIKIFDALDLDV